MKESNVFLKKIADGLKSLSQGIEVLADKVETMAKAQRQEATNAEVSEKTRPSDPFKVPGNKGTGKAAKMNVPRKPREINASRRVLAVISASKEGVDTPTLKKKTGYDDKKIHSIIYKLKKQGKIKSERRGVYTGIGNA